MSKSTTSVRRRSGGEGTVYPYRGGHRGAITWTDPDGKRQKRIVTGRTAAEARAKLDDLRRELRLGVLARSGPGITVGEYLTGWIKRHKNRVRPSTYLTAESYVRVHLIPALGKRPLARLTAVDVETALASFTEEGRPVVAGDKRPRQPVSGVTARHIRAVLRRALSDAVRPSAADRPQRCRGCRAAPRRASAITYLKARDLAKLLNATADDELGPMWALAATTGLRRGELLGLTWADVADGKIVVRRSMGRITGNGWGLGEVKAQRPAGRSRSLPAHGRPSRRSGRSRCSPRTPRAMLGRTATDWCSRTRLGDRCCPSTSRTASPETWSEPTFRGSDSMTCAIARQRHCSRLVCPLAVISEWLGHSGIAITKSAYAAVVPELLTDAADAMDRALSG